MAEQSSVVWLSSIISGEGFDIENYLDYKNALYLTNLNTLKGRRSMLRTKDIFLLAVKNVNTRHSKKYEVTKAKTNRLLVSAIPSMQSLTR